MQIERGIKHGKESREKTVRERGGWWERQGGEGAERGDLKPESGGGLHLIMTPDMGRWEPLKLSITLCCCRRFTENTVAQLWYFTKCIYFALSAYQIRCGYPTRILGNFLTKKYNYVNLLLFKV